MPDRRVAADGAPRTLCGEILRAHDPDRYLCCLFAARRRRDALFAVFAFNHEVARIREVVGEPMLGELRLQWWRDSIDGIVAGRPPAHPVALGVAEAFRDFGLEAAPFERVIAARERDLDDAPIPNLEELALYAEATGAGLLPTVLRILDQDTPSALARATDVAVAWTLTGLLRSTPHLARAGRCMLPAGYGLVETEYSALRDHAGLRQTVRAVAGHARARLERARRRGGTPFRPLAPALLPGRLAGLYLKRLERADWNSLDPAVNAPMPMKPWTLAAASLLQRI